MFIVTCVIFQKKRISLLSKNENIVLQEKDSYKIINQVSAYKVFALFIVGHSTLTSVLFDRSKKYGFSIIFMNNNFHYIGTIGSEAEGNYLLRLKQYHFSKTLALSQHIVKNKINNQLNLLKLIRNKSNDLKSTILNLKQSLKQVNIIEEEKSLLGIEGNCSKQYLKHVFKELNFQGRRPRTKKDPLNITLDIGYTYLFNFIECLMRLYGFDIYVGVYHKLFYQRKSLVCDLVEPFRCLIDEKIVSSFGLKQFKEVDFEKRKEEYVLKKEEVRKYTKVFFKSLLKRKEEIFTYIQSYYRAFMQEKK